MMKLVKLQGDAERATQTTLDTIEINRKQVAAWKSPPFQREIRMTPKVMALVDEIKATGVLPGVLTLGVLDGQVFIVDGQHRLTGFIQSELVMVYADVRTHYFPTMSAMAAEFVKLNRPLVPLRPDDILRGMEQANAHLQRIRKKCPYVGYDAVRRGAKSPVLSMSQLLRAWIGSRAEVPSIGVATTTAAEMLDEADTDRLIEFLGLCFEAWHRDAEYQKLWGGLNLILCAWLYRRVVLGDAGKGVSRSKKLTPDQFKRGLLSLSASSDYLDYLVGRNIGERDRAPAYNRMKALFAARYYADTGQKLQLPQPTWSHSASGR